MRWRAARGASAVAEPADGDPVKRWLATATRATCNICGGHGTIDVPAQAESIVELREVLGCRTCGGISRDRALVAGLATMLGETAPLASWAPDQSRRMFETSGYRGHPRFLPQLFDYYNLPYVPPPEDAAGEALDARIGADLQDLQFPDGFFDVVMTAEVLEHVPDEQLAIREIARVLRPGGHLILEVPYAHGMAENSIRVSRWHGRDVFLYPPEYHAEHTLVYRIYGRRLLADLAGAGLAVAHLMLEVPELAITPQTVIVATKAPYVDLAGLARPGSILRPAPAAPDGAGRGNGGRDGDGEPALLAWPLDHYYSPVPDSRRLSREPARSRVWPPTPPETPGLDWRAEAQAALLAELGRQSELRFADQQTDDPHEYHAANGMFSRLDAWTLQAILRHLRPARIIEVGCGWSSLVSARVNREFLGGAADVTCIEPYPPDFLKRGVDGITRLIPSPVEEVPVSAFDALWSGDVLFIDSSHTVKTGGDVVFLFQEVLPRLRPGVAVHIHDIFLPWDYPPDWVLAGRAWNEQYLIRAFLAFNSAFHILLAVGWLAQFRPDALAAALPGYPERFGDGGGSLWIQRT